MDNKEKMNVLLDWLYKESSKDQQSEIYDNFNKGMPALYCIGIVYDKYHDIKIMDK